MDRPSWVPKDIDTERPSVARVYDYNLGGSHNFAVDRRIAERLAAIMPEMPLICRANRSFLGRSLRFMLNAGVRQFIDLGSGIPTVGNVHEIVEKTAPESTVVYIDNDPIAVAHSEALLRGKPNAAVAQADLRDTEGVLNLPQVSKLIDFSQPVGVLLVSVLHFVLDREDPASLIARYRAPLVSGSHIVISHGAAPEDDRAPTGGSQALDEYSQQVAEVTLRTRAQVADLLAGLEIVDPGVVYVNEWRIGPGDIAERMAQIVGVGRVP